MKIICKIGKNYKKDGAITAKASKYSTVFVILFMIGLYHFYTKYYKKNTIFLI